MAPIDVIVQCTRESVHSFLSPRRLVALSGYVKRNISLWKVSSKLNTMIYLIVIFELLSQYSFG